MFAVHEKAVQVAKDLLHAEVVLPSYLQEIEREEIFRKLGYPNMHEYCMGALKLSRNQTYTYLGVARRCVKVPELQVALESGDISTETARRLLPVLKKENSETWISLAKEIPQKALEREVAIENAKINPKSRIREKIKPIADNVLEFRSAIDSETEALLTRCKELMSQKSKSAANWNLVLKRVAQEFIERNDPVIKAERNAHKPTRQVFTAKKSRDIALAQKSRDIALAQKSRHIALARQSTRYIPAPLKHQVFLRDKGKCQAGLPDGSKCNCERWIEIHHRIPLSQGGRHSLDNLLTLCSSHHAAQHSALREPWRRRGTSVI